MDVQKLPITEEKVKEILKTREKMKADIRKKMYAINKDLFQNDEMYELVSYPSTEMSDMPRRKGWHKDLGDVLINYRKVIADRKIQYQGVLWDLIAQEECIERVWLAFQVLAEPYYSILSELYVKRNKYEVAQQESGYSLKAFEKHRKNGVNLIIQIYESDKQITTLEHIVSSAKANREKIKDKRFFDNENYQINMDDILNNLEQESSNEK